MPMPALDPARFVPAILSDATHKLPMPDRGGRLFSQDPAAPETVDIFDPFYAGLLADGSIRRACPVAVGKAQFVKEAGDPPETTSKGDALDAGAPDPSADAVKPAA